MIRTSTPHAEVAEVPAASPEDRSGTAHHAAYTPGALSLREFCEAYGLNRATVFKLRREGLGPDELVVGRRILITHAAAREWEMRMQARARTERIKRNQATGKSSAIVEPA
ncbi:hypothetical protein [Paraburkholderia saeva]|uniref:Helix-turn-helix domain-containing protein n=1 Tax=Paraburkholderia saeva TaxID=2777537 RepID=A0A9N8RWP0_9BURK|nr:hypothetical protein [Paraburkholderia saeva]CAG4903094.1 hypothetical protein LMG31841_03185 [Paraburkholderia saeva]